MKFYGVLKLVAGLMMAAFTAWKLIVIKVINTTAAAASRKVPTPMSIR